MTTNRHELGNLIDHLSRRCAGWG